MSASWISDRAGLRLERRPVAARDGLVGLAQTFRGDGVRVVVTHRAAMVAHVTIEQGSFAFLRSNGEVAAPRAFVLVIPPRSIVRMSFCDAIVSSVGVAGS